MAWNEARYARRYEPWYELSNLRIRQHGVFVTDKITQGITFKIMNEMFGMMFCELAAWLAASGRCSLIKMVYPHWYMHWYLYWYACRQAYRNAHGNANCSKIGSKIIFFWRLPFFKTGFRKVMIKVLKINEIQSWKICEYFQLFIYTFGEKCIKCLKNQTDSGVVYSVSKVRTIRNFSPKKVLCFC